MRLDELAKLDHALGLGNININADGVLELNHPPRPAHHQFQLDGLVFHLSAAPEAERFGIELWADVGSMPFTVEDPARRKAAYEVLRGSTGLGVARFVLQGGNRVVLAAREQREGSVDPIDMIRMVVETVGQARPFMRLFRALLAPPRAQEPA